jgi:hypothetical protein
LLAKAVHRKVTIMKPDPENRPGRKTSDEGTPSQAQPRSVFWLMMISAGLSAVLFANSWLSGSGSWPDWVYVLLVAGSLAFVVVLLAQRWAARSKRS